jgi:GNAT superfamily N-acetyltransferase
MSSSKDTTALDAWVRSRGPSAESIRNLLVNAVGSRLKGVWVDNPEHPRAVICRSYFAYLDASDRKAAAKVVANVSGGRVPADCSVPSKLWSVMDDAGAKWYGKPVHQYMLEGRPRALRGNKVDALRRQDAATVYIHHTDYPIDRGYLQEQIRVAPSCAIRRDGELVAWALTHDCGAMGLLYVHEKYRRAGLGVAVTLELAARLREAGVTPFAFVPTDNEASISTCEKAGFRRSGTYRWYGLQLPKVSGRLGRTSRHSS